MVVECLFPNPYPLMNRIFYKIYNTKLTCVYVNVCFLSTEKGVEFYMQISEEIKEHASKQDGELQNESFPYSRTPELDLDY